MDVNLGDTRPEQADGTHLTSEQADRIEGYVREVLKALDLGHWRVFVGKDRAPEGARLSIWPTDGRRIACLNIAPDWWREDTTEDKRTGITHECLHLAHHDTDAHIRAFLDESGDISDYVKSLVLSQFKTNLERMVDSLSYVLAPHMPAWTDGA